MSKRKDILKLISVHPQMTTTEIARKLGLSRTTVIKYLKQLSREGLISYRKVGSAKLWFIESNEAEKEAREALIREKMLALNDSIASFLSDGFALKVLDEDEIKVLEKVRKKLHKKIS